MIKEVTGDLLLSKATAIAHGIAPHDDFKQGLALSLREQWPECTRLPALLSDLQSQTGNLVELEGRARPHYQSVYPRSARRPSGQSWKSDRPNINHVLQALKKEIQAQQVTSLALPRLATGVGGLTWDEVKPLIHSTLKDLVFPCMSMRHLRRRCRNRTSLTEQVDAERLGKFGTSCAQRKPTFGSCSWDRPWYETKTQPVRLLMYDPPRCAFASLHSGHEG